MAASPGRTLLDVLQRELINGLHDAVAAVAADLEALDPDPAFNNTAFVGKVLAPVEADNPVLAALSGFASAEVAGVHTGLRGWRDEASDAAPRGIAYVVSSGGPTVAALSVVPPAGNRAVLRAAGFAAEQSLQVALDNGFALWLSGTTSGEIAITFFPDQPPAVTNLNAGDRIEVELTRGDQGQLLGIEGGPSVRFGSIAAGGAVANTPTQPFDRSAHLRLEGGEVALTPGFLAGLLPLDLSFPLDLNLRTTLETGVVLEGSPSLRARLTGPDAARWLDLGLEVDDAAADPALNVSLATSVDASLPGAPIRAHVDGLGLAMPISLRPGTPLLPDVAKIKALDPRGADVSIDLPVVSGSGALTHIGGDLVGALSVKIPPLSANAFGILTPGAGQQPLSFLVLIGATFPPPGIQVGFGFAISGVGGVVGVNRRIDRDALLRAITDGSAAQLLFPSDPVGSGEAAIKALPSVFPPAGGSVVAGPMFQLSWGGSIVTLSVAVLAEASTQVRLTILGKLVVALPVPEAPLVFLQASFAGIIDPAEPSVMFVASLSGSNIVGAPLSGDILLLTRGGSDPTLVLSAGGFHPSFRPPRGVPALQRMSVDLCPVAWIDLRCESYFALTSNTLQLGARLELVAEVAGCGLRGWLAFDALIQYSPFRFIADISGGIALRAFGHTLVGISLSLHLEGPAPYLARGRGSIDLFLFEVCFDFEVGWGSPPAITDPPADVGGELRRALSDPAAWRSRGAAPPGLLLTEPAQKALSDAAVVDPYGAVSVHEERIPLGIEIARFNGLPLSSPQRWDISAGQFGVAEPAKLTEVRAEFAPGQFVAPKSDDEALTAPAFLPLKAGVELHPEAAGGAEERPAGLTWEERVIARDIPMPEEAPVGQIADVSALEILVGAMSTSANGWWDGPEEVVTVEPVAPVSSAFSWSMAAGPGSTAATDLEMKQLLGGNDELITVEAWEVAH